MEREDGMFIVHVFVHVTADKVEAFKQAARENAVNSIKEPGVARFDIIQEQTDPTKFVLVEVYRSPDAAGLHKETPHYKKWRDKVADMMAKPRTSIKYYSVFPDDHGWG
jgi:autoinducer 2-degrading protein